MGAAAATHAAPEHAPAKSPSPPAPGIARLTLLPGTNVTRLCKSACACGGDCPRCLRETIQLVPEQTTPEETTAREASATVPHVIREALSSAGRPLDAGTRDFFESRFGRDLGHVRVHTGAKAAESALLLSARAYTLGRDIVFAAGRYNPHTQEGRRLLAHELTHVAQQSFAPNHGVPADAEALPVGRPGSSFEAAADQVAHLVVSRSSPARVRAALHRIPRVGSPLLQLDPELDPTELVTPEPYRTRNTYAVTQYVRTPSGSLVERYSASFYLNSRGVMTANVRTVTADGRFRSPSLSAGAAFRSAVAHFQSLRIAITAFRGLWATGMPTNLNAFNRAMRGGMTSTQAALSTSTGRFVSQPPTSFTNVTVRVGPRHRQSGEPVIVEPIFRPEGSPVPSLSQRAPTETPSGAGSGGGASGGSAPPAPPAPPASPEGGGSTSAASAAPSAAPPEPHPVRPSSTPPTEPIAPAETSGPPAASPPARQPARVAPPSRGRAAVRSLASGVLGFAAGALVGELDQHRTERQRETQGYVPVGGGAPVIESLFRLFILQDVYLGTQTSAESRTNIPVLRARMRREAARVAPGGTLTIGWQVHRSVYGFFQTVETVPVAYVRRANGTWAPGVPSGELGFPVPDLNRIIDLQHVTDYDVELMLYDTGDIA